MLCSWSVFSQNTFDSLAAFIKEFHLSVEAGYNFLIPSATVIDSYYIPYSTEVNGFPICKVMRYKIHGTTTAMAISITTNGTSPLPPRAES